MNSEIKTMVGIGIVTLAVLLGGMFFLSNNATDSSKTISDRTKLVQPYNHTISSDAKNITLVEFADFQCPACAAAYPIVKQVLEQYKGKITFVYRHYPLPQHKNAILASKTAEAAGKQDKFWQMYDLLYQRQEEWSESSNADATMERLARELQLNMDRFSQDLSNSVLSDQIQQDKDDGIELGVNSTPSFFLNNRKLSLRSLSDLPTIIGEEIAKTK